MTIIDFGNVNTMVKLYTTSDCPKCEKLAEFLTNKNISFKKYVIDKDPEAETDALMDNVFSAPALKKEGRILRTRDIFKGDALDYGKIMEFLKAEH